MLEKCISIRNDGTTQISLIGYGRFFWNRCSTLLSNALMEANLSQLQGSQRGGIKKKDFKKEYIFLKGRKFEKKKEFFQIYCCKIKMKANQANTE
jgi:hypothetical protein